MMNLHDHRFSPAYLLLYGRSIHQYTLQDNHFCSQHSAISSSNSVRRLGEKRKKVKEVTKKKMKMIHLLTFKNAPHPATSDFAKSIWISKRRKSKLWFSHIFFIHFDYEDGPKHQELLTLCCCLRRSLIFPHWPSPRLAGSPNEPSPQLHQICDFKTPQKIQKLHQMILNLDRQKWLLQNLNLMQLYMQL